MGFDKRLEVLSNELEWLQRQANEIEQRLEQVENSVVFRVLRRAGGSAQLIRRKLGQWLLNSPFHGLYRKLGPTIPDTTLRYRAWLAARQHGEAARSRELLRRMEQWASRPLLSVIIPVHDPRREWIEAAVDSVRRQSYPNWQLCLSDDASKQDWIKPWLEQQERQDRRIRWCSSSTPAGISEALNLGCRLAGGEYLGFLDHDDSLADDALLEVASALQEDNHLDLIYTDEQHVDEKGLPMRPNFKPGWSPELLTSCMYMGHLLVVRRALFDQAGGFRSQYDGAQDYDLALRLTESGARVAHLPRVLYHWREHSSSTSLSPAAKPFAEQAGRQALEGAVFRRGWQAEVREGALPNQFHIRRKARQAPLASIVICTRSHRLLEACLKGIADKTDYTRRELVVVQHQPDGAQDAGNQTIEAVIHRFNARRAAFAGPFHFAAMNNLGASAATGEMLVFLNDDVSPIGSDWLDILVAQLERPEIGVAGARLLYPGGDIQHAGIVLGIGQGTGHVGRHLFRSDWWKWLDFSRDVSAVTGACLGVRREVFTALQGFDEAFPVNYNDVDFCLRAHHAGYRVICEQRAVLRHQECASRRSGTRITERREFFCRWGELLIRGDPYYNPALADAGEQLEL